MCIYTNKTGVKGSFRYGRISKTGVKILFRYGRMSKNVEFAMHQVNKKQSNCFDWSFDFDEIWRDLWRQPIK
jgi:hypothetical protein